MVVGKAEVIAGHLSSGVIVGLIVTVFTLTLSALIFGFSSPIVPGPHSQE